MQHPNTKPQKSTRVLVIEDDPVTQRVDCYFLRSLGYPFDLAVTGRHALTLIDKNQYDLVLTDLGLPDVCDLDLIKQMRSLLKNVPIIVLTAHGNNQMQDCLQAGANDFFVKPIEFAVLQSCLNKWSAQIMDDFNFNSGKKSCQKQKRPQEI
jgi:CheY-like chemotaxis protein